MTIAPKEPNRSEGIPQNTPPKLSGFVIVCSLFLLTVHVVLINQSIHALSPAGPEIGHMVRGAEAILNRKSDLASQVHPYDYLVGLQLLSPPNNQRPTNQHTDKPIDNQLDQLVKQWLYMGTFNASNSPLIYARQTTMILSVLLGLMVLMLSRKLWGNQGALLSLALYCFSPSILAHASLATPDLANALILVVLATWTWHAGCKRSATGTPHPLWPVMLLLLAGLLQKAMANKPLPTELWQGAWFLNGNVSKEHLEHFYFYCFLVKTPIVTWVILALALGAWIKRKGHRRREIQQAWPMICIGLTTLYTAAGMTSPIGHRLLLPLYPVLFIFAGSATVWPTKSKTPSPQNAHTPNPSWLCGVAICVLAFQAWQTMPDFLTFTNRAAGPRDRAWQHLASDNMDWGQAHRRSALHANYLASYGPMAQADQATSDISLLQWNNAPLKGGVYVISSNYISGAVPDVLPRDWTHEMETQYQRLRDYFNNDLLKQDDSAKHSHDHQMPQLSHEQWLWLRLRLARLCAHLRIREPDTVIGKSMLSYQLSDEQVQYMLTTAPYPQRDETGLMN